MLDQIAAIQRQKDYEKIRAEKEAAEREKKRLQLELLKDKIERHERAGNPVPKELLEQLAVLMGTKKAEPVDLRTSLKGLLTGMAAGYRGETAKTSATTLRTICLNPLEHKEEAKYRTLDLTRPALAKRIQEVSVALNFLLHVGWKRDETIRTTLKLAPDADEGPLRIAVDMLTAELAANAFD